MNQKLALVFVVTSWFALPVIAQDAQNNGDKKVSGTQDSNAKVAYTDLAKANKIIGMDITGAQDQKLGKVKDLAIDLQSGRIVEVIVGTGGFIGVDEKMVAVPPQALTYADSNKKLQLKDAETFRSAPNFKLSHWKDATSTANVQDVYQRYHVGAPSGTTGSLERADKIMGLMARNQQREHLGKVNTLVVDLSGGRVVEVILETGGFLGIKEELSAVPPQAFRFNPDDKMLTLDTTKDALKNAPHFKPSEWRNSVNDSASLTGVYHAYGVQPYFTPENAQSMPQSTSQSTVQQNAVPQEASAPNNANAAQPQSDGDITARIQQLIAATTDLSVNARAVQVTTSNGRVTLQGTADSDKEKKQLGDLAATVVAADHVDNQIAVKNLGAASTTMIQP